MAKKSLTDILNDLNFTQKEAKAFSKCLDEVMNPEGTWSIAKNPATGEYEIKFIVGYAQVQVEDENEETRIDAKATEDIDITEASGETGIGQIISENGNVELNVPGNLIDVTTPERDGEDAVNIKAMNANSTDGKGDVTINASQGAVGSQNGRIDIDAAGR